MSVPSTNPQITGAYYVQYQSPYSKGVAFQYINDTSLILRNQQGVPYATGGFRPAAVTDFAANISVSGLNLTVGGVAITGSVPIPISNPVYSVYITGGYVGITGTSLVSIQGTPTVINGGGYVGLTGSPLVTVGNTSLNVAVTGGSIMTIVTGSVSTSVNAVAVTGAPVVSLTGVTPVTITNGVLPISGSITVSQGPVTIVATSNTGAPLAVSGVFTASIGNVAVTGGSISVNNTSPIAISGVVSATVIAGPTTIVATPNTGAPLAISGNVTIPGTVNVYNQTELGLLSGISGALATNLNGAAWVTGQVQAITTGISVVSGIGTFSTVIVGTPTVTVGNTTLNVAVTGGSIQTIVTGTVSSSITNPIGITGTATDVNVFYSGGPHPWNYLPVGGRAAAATGQGSVTGYNTGDYAIFNINNQNGGLFVNQGCLDQTQDNVTIWYASSGAASVSTTSGINNAGFGVALPNNPSRRAWGVQNTSTGVLLVNFSATIPTTGSFSILLKGGTTAFDGNGGTWIDAPAIYTGPVSITGLANSSPSYNCWQI